MRSQGFVRLALLLIVAGFPAVSRAQFQPPLKEELSMTSDPKAPGADAVYLEREEREDDPHHFRTVYARIKVLTEAGKELATVSVVYQKRFVYNATGNNSSHMGGTSNHWDTPDINQSGQDRPLDPFSFVGHVEVAAIEGRTIHPDGTVIPLTGSPSDLLKTKAGSDQYNEMTFNMPAVEVGSIIEYRYQVRYDRFQSAPEWQIQQPYFVHHAHYQFIPAEMFSSSHSGGGVGDSFLLSENGEPENDLRAASILPGGKILQPDPTGQYTLDLRDIPPIPNEAYAPPLGSQVYQVSFYYTYTPDEKEFWQKEMNWWTREVNRYVAPTSALKNTVEETIGQSDSAMDKAKKLYALVQKLENTNINQHNAGSVVPKGSVEDVLEDKKGSPSQLAFLYLGMARIAGLTARPERISSRENRTFSPGFLSTNQLDAMVIGLDIDGKHITVDPGVKAAPFQTLYWAHNGTGGVAMGSNGKVETVITPLPETNENSTVRVGSLNVSPQGTVSGSLKVGFTGQRAIHLRQLALTAGSDAMTSEINGALASQVPAGVTAQVDRVANVDDYTKQLVALVVVSGAVQTHSGARLILPRSFFQTRESNPFPSTENRTMPVNMPYSGQEQEQITYVLPQGYTLEGRAEDALLKWDQNAVYQLKSKLDVNSITTARVLARGFTLLEAKDYGQLRDFYQKVIASDQQQLVFTAAQPSGQ
jgi:Domain of Unknown Function with PDB structure (DUF3857)